MSQALTVRAKHFQLLPWLCLLICLVALVARILPGPRTVDDAYITFRYARNILAGTGFVFNPGERVLGTTTPFYTMILVLAYKAFQSLDLSFPVLALVINAVADTLTCYLLFQFGLMFANPRVAVGVALAWAIAPYSVTFAIGGLETSVYILVLIASVYFHIRENHLLAAGSSALALLTRPDALILVIPLIIDRLWQIVTTVIGKDSDAERIQLLSSNSLRVYFLELLVFIIPIVAWLCFATIYFGSPIPHSIAAKSLAYRIDSESAMIRLLQHYLTPFLEHLTFGMKWILAAIIFYPFLYFVGAGKAVKINSRIWPFVIYPGLYFIIFSSANPLIFRWYLTPPLPSIFLFLMLGIDYMLWQLTTLISNLFLRTGSNAIKPGHSTSFAKTTCFLIIIFLPVCFSLKEWTLHPDHGFTRPVPEMSWYKLELLYREAAEFLRPSLESSQGHSPVLAAGDVGVLGYYTGARILDTVGLNSPVSSTYYPLDQRYYTINYAVPPQLILDQLPDYLVFLEVYGREGLFKDARVSSLYSVMRTFPTDIYGSKGLVVMVRK